MTAVGGTRTVPAGDAIRRDTALRRGADVVVACTGLIALAPVLLLIVLSVRLSGGGPAVFRQRRVGRDGRPFEMWKFRTMVVGADRIGPLVSGTSDPRITGVGRWLRISRLDELPQLVNLLRGDLSLIGPRPEVERFLPHYSPGERRLLSVRPGVLGPGALLFVAAQADELDAVEDPDTYYVEHHLHPKLALDLAYLAERGVLTDVRLVARAVVLVGTGVLRAFAEALRRAPRQAPLRRGG